MHDNALREPLLHPEGQARRLECFGGSPVVFGACAGFWHGGPSEICVLVVGALGFEDFTIRPGLGFVAQRLARAGYSVLRFDAPSTGNSLGEDLDLERIDQWRAAIELGAQQLRAWSGARALILLGHGLGGLMALDMAERVGAWGAIVMAPTAEGSAGMREFTIQSGLIASSLRMKPETFANAAVDVAGFAMVQSLIEDFKNLQFARTPTHSLRAALVLARPDHASDAQVIEILRARGAIVDALPYEGYNAFVAYDNTPQPPLADFDAIVAWLRAHELKALADTQDQNASAPRLERKNPSQNSMAHETFEERPLIFGAADRLFGILCLPRGRPARAVVIIVNSGYNPHIGWARSHVRLARALAAEGVASLRMDLGGLGESARDPSGRDDPPYSPRHIEDLCAGVDAAETVVKAPIVLMGRCSGAYIAIQAAPLRASVKGLLAVNAVRLIWRPHETLAQMMKIGTSSLADYRARAMSFKTLQRILRGEIRVMTAVNRASNKIASMAATKFVRFMGPLTQHGRLRRDMRQFFDNLLARGVHINLLYAENDGGLDELSAYCGPMGRDFTGHPHFVVNTLAGSEHNMTSRADQARMLQSALDIVKSIEEENNALN